jgi:hypothetical protein
MKNIPSALLATGFTLALAIHAPAAPPSPTVHDTTLPPPPVVDPGYPGDQSKTGKAPSDAVVLFDGGDLAQWSDVDGKPTKWIIREGVMECVKGSGYIRTWRSFGDCQLHVEWATPSKPEGTSQGRGNSGVFFGGMRYEVQVLDSYQNKTYADGSAASVYGQYPPAVNVSRGPGQWQTYDIIYLAPRFEADGKLKSPARLTVFHNGVLVQNNVEVTGPTGWVDRAPYAAHPVKQPIAFQDHGNPVRYRNVWVRELGNPGRAEYSLSRDLLDTYTGKYEGAPDVLRDGDQLTVNLGGIRLFFFAESPTKFFCKTTDVQMEFKPAADGKVTEMLWSMGGDEKTVRRK